MIYKRIFFFCSLIGCLGGFKLHLYLRFVVCFLSRAVFIMAIGIIPVGIIKEKDRPEQVSWLYAWKDMKQS